MDRKREKINNNLSTLRQQEREGEKEREREEKEKEKEKDQKKKPKTMREAGRSNEHSVNTRP